MKPKLKEKDEEKHAKDINKFNGDLKSGISGDVANKMGKLTGIIWFNFILNTLVSICLVLLDISSNQKDKIKSDIKKAKKKGADSHRKNKKDPHGGKRVGIDDKKGKFKNGSKSHKIDDDVNKMKKVKIDRNKGKLWL